MRLMIGRCGRRKLLLLLVLLLCSLCVVLVLQKDMSSAVRAAATRPLPQAARVAVPRCPSQQHKMAVLVPFRDRFDELMQFVPRISDFLRRSCVHFEIFVLNQVDEYRFNRGSLLNVGALAACPDCDYFALHDVDLVPQNAALRYRFPAAGPLHMTPPQLHPLYHYPKFLGGILLIRREHFELANGMSNLFWGWGREDDEFRLRVLRAGLKISRPRGIRTSYNTFEHLHDPRRRPRDSRLYYNQRVMTFRLDQRTGLRDTKFSTVRRYGLTVNGSGLGVLSGLGRATVLDIALHCDEGRTPYCRRPDTD